MEIKSFIGYNLMLILLCVGVELCLGCKHAMLVSAHQLDCLRRVMVYLIDRYSSVQSSGVDIPAAVPRHACDDVVSGHPAV